MIDENFYGWGPLKIRLEWVSVRLKFFYEDFSGQKGSGVKNSEKNLNVLPRIKYIYEVSLG